MEGESVAFQLWKRAVISSVCWFFSDLLRALNEPRLVLTSSAAVSRRSSRCTRAHKNDFVRKTQLETNESFVILQRRETFVVALSPRSFARRSQLDDDIVSIREKTGTEWSMYRLGSSDIEGFLVNFRLHFLPQFAFVFFHSSDAVASQSTRDARVNDGHVTRPVKPRFVSRTDNFLGRRRPLLPFASYAIQLLEALQPSCEIFEV